MQGCGLEEIFSEITGRNTVQHILTGKAYSTAVQAHLINNIADCPDGKTTTNTFFETKLVIGSTKVITEPIENTVFEHFRQNRANGDAPEIVTQTYTDLDLLNDSLGLGIGTI